MTAVAAAFYPIFFYPYMHKKEYSKCFYLFVTFNVYNRTPHNVYFNVNNAAISLFFLFLASLS